MSKISVAIVISACLANAQDASREIWDTGFLQKRPVKKASTPSRGESAIAYHTDAPAERQKQANEPIIGLTLWRLRTPGKNDTEDARLLVQDTNASPAKMPFVPERINLSEALHEGERVRLSIESPRVGYLYVVDRERYDEGSLGDPVLIFPAMNFRSGENHIEPGRLIEIPPQDSNVPALKVQRSSEHHVGEELLIIVTPQPIANLHIQPGETKLDAQMVSGWEKNWGVTPMRLDLMGREHVAWTSSEKAAGASNLRLTQNDPMPATILSIAPDGDKPSLVRVPLDIRDR